MPTITNTSSRFHEADLRNGSKGPAFWLIASFFLCFAMPLSASESATVTFTLDFPKSDPEHYSISVLSDGHVKYQSTARISQDSDDTQDYQTDFVLSDAIRARIFDLAAQAHYFSEKVDAGNKKLAFTGAKKLAYQDSQRNASAEYNFSSVPAIQQLTTLFQSVAATLEFGRRLTYDHRYQKLALDDELKRLEDEAHRGELAELQAIKPILQDIYDDQSVIKVVRARALRIMESGSAGPGGH